MSYLGNDGGKYNTMNEKIAADNRYKQQQEILRELKRQNDLKKKEMEEGYRREAEEKVRARSSSTSTSSTSSGDGGEPMLELLLLLLAIPFILLFKI